MDIQSYLVLFLNFIGNSLLPLIGSLAFLFLLWNITKYFLIHSAEDEGRERARRLLLWGLIALVMIVALWGIVNVFVDILGVGTGGTLKPDYMGGGSSGITPTGGGSLDMPPCTDGRPVC